MFDGVLFGRELAVEVKRMIAPLGEEVRTLRARVAEFGSCGRAKAAGQVSRNLSTGGAANKLTTEAPGDGCADWTLCLKHGRDTRDVNATRR
jgi:hypothetical protein